MNMYDKVAATILGAAVGLAFITAGCDKPPPPPVKHEVAHVDPPAPPPPVATNPFEKPVPGPIHEIVQPSHWEMVGDVFKMNDSWFLYTWRDAANHTTCYFYNEMGGDDHKSVIGHGMSCVKE